MVLKYSDKPQLRYDSDNSRYNFNNRFPEGWQPIATAPQQTAQPVLIYESNGQGHWALHHQGAWRKLAPFKDGRAGAVNWRMDGTMVSNPVAWSPRKK
jgi:hypothetical protein